MVSAAECRLRNGDECFPSADFICWASRHGESCHDAYYLRSQSDRYRVRIEWFRPLSELFRGLSRSSRKSKGLCSAAAGTAHSARGADCQRHRSGSSTSETVYATGVCAIAILSSSGSSGSFSTDAGESRHRRSPGRVRSAATCASCVQRSWFLGTYYQSFDRTHRRNRSSAFSCGRNALSVGETTVSAQATVRSASTPS
jgi:hypothetical protein